MDEKLLHRHWKQIVFCFESQISPARTVRRRGYKDKGTRRDASSVARSRLLSESDYLAAEHKLIEEKRQSRQDNRILLKNYLEGVGSLDDAQLCYFRLKKGETEYGRKESTYPGRESLLERERDFESRIEDQRRRQTAVPPGREIRKYRISDQKPETYYGKPEETAAESVLTERGIKFCRKLTAPS
jgi:hypothetical protein